MLGYFFYPNAGFSLLGHFIGLFLIFLPRFCWGIFLTQMLGSACWVILLGYFLYFLPRCWVVFLYLSCWVIFNTGLFFLPKPLGWASPMKQPSCWVTVRAQAFCVLQERAVLSATNADLVHFFSEIKVCIPFISYISSLYCAVNYIIICNAT